MKRIGLIGLGEIAKFYKDGFLDANYLDLVACSDIKKKPSSFLDYKHLPIYADYKEMIKVEMLDYVIIATEPKNHYEIARYCLEQGLNVLIEPPAGINYNEVCQLISYARDNALLFDVMSHPLMFEEVKYFKEHINEYGQLKEVYLTINRPFCSNPTTIDKEHSNLNGCYIYDAYYCFDLLSLFLPFKKVILIEKKTRKDLGNKNDIMTDLLIYVDGVNVHIKLDWTCNSNLCNSKFVFAKNIVNLCHSSQIITINVREQINCKTTRHYFADFYYKYFSNYQGMTNYDHILSVHKVMMTMKELE